MSVHETRHRVGIQTWKHDLKEKADMVREIFRSRISRWKLGREESKMIPDLLVSRTE